MSEDFEAYWNQKVDEAIADDDVNDQSFSELLDEREKAKAQAKVERDKEKAKPKPERLTGIEAEIAERKERLAELDESPSALHERHRLRGELATLNETLTASNARQVFADLSDEHLVEATRDLDVKIEELTEQLNSLPQTRSRARRGKLERQIAEARAQEGPMRVEAHQRAEDRRYETGREQVVAHTALAERTRIAEDAKRALAMIEADIQRHGYHGQGPLIEEQRARLAAANALTGPPSEEELESARKIVADRYGLVAP